MTKIEIKPLHGIVIDGLGYVLLNQPPSEIVQLLGNPSEYSTSTQFFYDFYELRIDFDEQGMSFIEFINGPYPERTELSIYGINPFKVGADNLIGLLALKNDGILDDSEAEYAYAFFNISVGVWRQATEQDVQTSIDEAKRSGSDAGQVDQLTEELETVKNFWTIGMGRAGYYEGS